MPPIICAFFQGNYEQLVPMNVPIEGKVPKMPNSVTVASDGTVYWTDSLTEGSLEDGLYSLLSNGNGRYFLKYKILNIFKHF